MKIKNPFGLLFSIDKRPGRLMGAFLSSLLFAAIIGAYLYGAGQRHRENPDDRVMPLPSALAAGAYRAVTELEPRFEMPELPPAPYQPTLKDRAERVWLRFAHTQLVVDTYATIKRFTMALGIILLAIPFGVAMGMFPYFGALGAPFSRLFDKIPAFSLLAILILLFGIDEASKIALVVIGVFPSIALDAALKAEAVPAEQKQKAKTLGATDLEIAYRVILPQMAPEMLDTLRLNFKAMATLLIAAESIAAEAGLGYRIFIVRKYMAMDTIIPYVVWLSLVFFFFDIALGWFITRRYPWYQKES